MNDTEEPITDRSATGVPSECREWLREIADHLIPASATMPSAREAGVGDTQLDVVLKSRPDLSRHLLRAWISTGELGADAALGELRQLDVPAYQALLLVVAGGYYSNSEVRDLLGYTGQRPSAIQIADDIDEELLARVVRRGSRYREV
ncbi:hypothetical protein ACQP1G_26325 [Nocardia sp. CA-107356]|uniref:hypothetical protein n=1 Tax=Nocardia sp. CA-107356 TaxID=3239972 RepID=UPI003D8D70A5